MDDGTHEDEIRVVDDVPRRSAAGRPVPVIPDEPGFLRRNLAGILWGIVLVLVAIFIGQNWRDERMDAYFWSFTTKLSFALIAAALLGAILGWLLPMLMRRRSRRDRDREQV